jgi:hypothetical protein
LNDDIFYIDGGFLSANTALETLNLAQPVDKDTGRGWTRYETLMRCTKLYEYKYRQVDAEGNRLYNISSSDALDTGIFFHAFMDMLYTVRMDNSKPEPRWAYDKLLDMNVNPKALGEAWRLFSAYVDNYEGEDLTPVAVEARHKYDGMSCRYDLVAKVGDKIHIVEHKTARMFDFNTLHSWDLHGELLTQLMIWRACKLDDVYGKLDSIIVNIIGKQKVPNFHREVVAIDWKLVDAHIGTLKWWDGIETLCRASGYYPRNNAGCVNRYGRCEFYEECSVDI